jgi:DNA mismatch repair protein MutS
MNPSPSNPAGFFTLSDQTFRDLELDRFFKKIFPGRQEAQDLANYFRTIPLDPKQTQERQNILQDLMVNPRLIPDLLEILPLWQKFSLSFSMKKAKGGKFVQALGQIRELVLWAELIQSLDQALEKGKSFTSDYFVQIQKQTREIQEQPEFTKLVQALPELHQQIAGVRSVTIGLNLDTLFKPVGATLLSFSSEPFTETKKNAIAELFTPKGLSGKVYEPPRKKQSIGFEHSVDMDPDLVGWAIQPESLPLFQEMGQLLERSSKKTLRGLKAFSQLDPQFWAQKYSSLNFFLRVAAYYQTKADEGLPWSFPSFGQDSQPKADHEAVPSFQARDLHHPLLLLDPKVQSVPNQVDSLRHGRIQVITGPNRGGKTIYLQAIGMNQILGQMGLPVFAQACTLGPIRSCYTHFPREESSQNHTGRFGEEIRRLAEIFQRDLDNSLVLLNEPFTSTNASEAAEIARDSLLLLAQKGALSVFTTHFLDLPPRLLEENADPDRPIFASLVSCTTEEQGTRQRTFRIAPGLPERQSFARELAKSYGLDFSSLQIGRSKPISP